MPERPALLRLVPPRVCSDTVREIRKLLKSAELGETIGFAGVAISATSFSVHAAGQALERPTLTRGAIGVLKDRIRERQRPR